MDKNNSINYASFLCKAKNVEEKWVVGYFLPEHTSSDDEEWCRIQYQIGKEKNEYSAPQTVLVNANTICRCLGFKDINGKYVFDNHFVKHYNSQNGKDDKTSFELGRIFFDEESLSWKRTIEYTQENGQKIVKSYTPPRKTAPTVQMSALNNYELLGYAPEHTIEEYI